MGLGGIIFHFPFSIFHSSNKKGRAGGAAFYWGWGNYLTVTLKVASAMVTTYTPVAAGTVIVAAPSPV